ncbi:hypothetical protein KBB96_08670 [Luteolibacter ambystomatis]|uniref:Uncharacterized protein n=2 Tax=Luteolibacter ambystomatis TaxID=2824561 RepID=A0A975J2S0_9BACT|nr:hypothetical protein [Luteolibacter ambystomatis]QUE52951.1 hypothetical protein KBB96_08670 [Luteolibacter ambystomatis]
MESGHGLRIKAGALMSGMTLVILGLVSCKDSQDKSGDQSHPKAVPLADAGHGKPAAPTRHHGHAHAHEHEHGGASLSSLPPRIAELAEKQPAEALDLAKALPAGEREQAIKTLLLALAEERPEFVARELEASTLGRADMAAVGEVLVGYWPDSRKALLWADQTFKGADRGQVIGAALAALVESSPGDALAFVDGMPVGQPREAAFNRMMQAWAGTDLTAAVEYARGVKDPAEAAAAMATVADMWAAKDAAGAAAFLSGTAGEPRYAMLAQLVAANQVRTGDPAAALAWAATVPGPSGLKARESAIAAWSDVNPAAAAAYLDKAGAPALVPLGPKLAGEWSARDPAAAARWVEASQSSAQGAMVAEVMQNWLKASPRDASTWLDSLPEGPARDHGILVLLRREASGDPAGVFPWADALSTPAAREAEMKRLQSLMAADYAPINGKRH